MEDEGFIVVAVSLTVTMILLVLYLPVWVVLSILKGITNGVREAIDFVGDSMRNLYGKDVRK